MDLFKFFLKDDDTAVGLNKFRDKRDYLYRENEPPIGFRKQYFKPDYSNNFFLL